MDFIALVYQALLSNTTQSELSAKVKFRPPGILISRNFRYTSRLTFKNNSQLSENASLFRPVVTGKIVKDERGKNDSHLQRIFHV